MSKKIDLTGQQFGELVVLKETKNRDSNGSIIWKCQCSCGNITEVSSKHLRNCGVKTCGKCSSPNKINEIGKKYGKLTVINKAPSRSGRAYWLCQCDCGKVKEISGTNLRKGQQSCGCKSIYDKIGQKYGYLTVLQQLPDNEWKCQCDCGNITIAKGAQLNKGHKLSCGCMRSKGEAAIVDVLNKMNINFIQEKMFDNCVFPDSKQKARFDFYLPDHNLIIEYDGKQHYTGWIGQDNLEKIQNHDRIKTEWCDNNNISLLRIPYFEYDNIEAILKTILL